MKWVTRIKLEFRDVLELFVLPGLASVLPWTWCFGIFKSMARWQWLYRDAVEQSLSHAKQIIVIEDEDQWRWTRRLLTLVDHADHYLGLFRSDAWMTKHMRVKGEWAQPGQAALLATFHWGAGYWGLRHAAAQGVSAHAIVAALNPAHFAGRTVLFAYARSRTRLVATALGNPTLDVSGNLRPVIKALKQNEAIIAVVDVPADQFAAHLAVNMFGRQMHVPSGMMRLTVDRRVAVFVNTISLDLQTGQRFLHIRSLGVPTDTQAIANEVFGVLREEIEERPSFWHFWSLAERFFPSQHAEAECLEHNKTH